MMLKFTLLTDTDALTFPYEMEYTSAGPSWIRVTVILRHLLLEDNT
jgi:hypothetical protein